MIHEEFGDQVTVLGIASRDELPAMEAFVRNTSVEEFTHLADIDATVWQDFSIGSQPAFVFVNDDGEWEAHQGALGFAGLAAQVDALIQS